MKNNLSCKKEETSKYNGNSIYIKQYLEIDSTAGPKLRLAYVDEGPRDEDAAIVTDIYLDRLLATRDAALAAADSVAAPAEEPPPQAAARRPTARASAISRAGAVDIVSPSDPSGEPPGVTRPWNKVAALRVNGRTGLEANEKPGHAARVSVVRRWLRGRDSNP